MKIKTKNSIRIKAINVTFLAEKGNLARYFCIFVMGNFFGNFLHQGVTLDGSTPLIQLSAALFTFLYYSNVGKKIKKNLQKLNKN